MALLAGAQRFQQRARAVQVGTHAQVEIGLAFARHRRGQVEHAVEGFVGQGGALIEQRADACADARVGQQVGRRRHLVGQHDRADGFAGQRAARQQRARQACADEATATGDEQFHLLSP